MNLKTLIKNILEENQSCSLDDNTDREHLENELYLHLKHEFEEQTNNILTFLEST